MDQERALVSRLKKGDHAAFRELVERHKENVYYLALDLAGNHYDAEDISQDVFIKVFRSIGTFREGAKLSTWLYRITMNTFIDGKRRKTLNVVSMTSGEGDDELDPVSLVPDNATGNPEREMTAATIGAHVDKALDALSDKERTVFVMRHYKDMQINEIAGSLNLAEGTVKSLLFRSIRKLRDRLSFYRDELGLEDSQ